MQSKTTSFLSLAALALAVGILAGTAGSSLWVSHGAALMASTPEKSKQELPRKQPNERLQLIADLAGEFGMSPHIVALVDRYARQYVDPSQPEWRLVQTPEFMTHLMLSVIWAESRGDPRAVGDSGRARGLTQIWLSTAQQYGEVTASELLEPELNLEYSFQHFHYLLRRYRGNLAMALYSWNRGEGTVDRLLRYGKTPVNGYGRKVYRASLAAAGD